MAAFPLTGWVTHVAFSDVVDPLPSRLRLVIEDFCNPPLTVVRITAFVHAVVRFLAVRRWDQLHRIGSFPFIVLHLDNITESTVKCRPPQAMLTRSAYACGVVFSEIGMALLERRELDVVAA